MLSESIETNPECRFQSWDSNAEGLDLLQVPTKAKQTANQFCSWKLCFAIQTDLLGEEGFSTDEKKILLTEHLLDHNWSNSWIFYASP